MPRKVYTFFYPENFRQKQSAFRINGKRPRRLTEYGFSRAFLN